MGTADEKAARIEAALAQVVNKATSSPCPARLAEAIRYAVFPGGGRLRPRWCLTVSAACGDRNPSLAEAAAAAVELLHCASLVQDDLPCFDDAALRRGQLSVHKRFGEEIAILVGDALIVMTFDAIAAHLGPSPAEAALILAALARAAGAPAGIAAGQAWESEASVDLVAYHHAKTAALFEAAAVAGAVAGGAEPEAWRLVGGLLGEAYQAADDIADALGESGDLGKPTHQDGQKARPSIVATLGADAAGKKLDDLLSRAILSIPSCVRRADVQVFVELTVARLCPPEMRHVTLPPASGVSLRQS